MLKPGCTLPNLANICSHKSTDANFYPFTEGDKDVLEKFQEDVVGGPIIVFTRKEFVGETFIRKSASICKSIVGIDASQIYPHSMFQPLITGLYTRRNLDSETGKLTPRQNKTSSFENMVMSYLQRTRPDCEIESFLTTSRQKKVSASVLMGFVLIETLCFKPWVAFTTSVFVKSCVPLSLKRIFKVVARESWIT